MAVIVHVGAHKTGTSLIQKYFRDRADDLAGSDLIAIPRSDSNRLIGWGDVVVERPMLLRRRVEAELRAAPRNVLISHENSIGRPFVPGRPGLYPDAARIATAIAESLAGLDAVVVLYVRPMADFVESYYLQTIHEGKWHSFDEWYQMIDHQALSWRSVVTALEAAFGEDRTMIGDFSEITDGQIDFLEGFMRRTGIPVPAKVRYAPRRNASISSVGLRIATQVNPYLESKEQRVATRKFLQEHFSNVTGDRARPMPPNERAWLTTRLAAEYETLAFRASESLDR